MAEDGTNPGGLKILLGVSGGVAAYKAVELASKLTGRGARVQTVMTDSACELIRPRSFEAVTRSAVFTSLWYSSNEYRINHIDLTKWADIIVTAPATANIIAKIANGICDDLLSTILCACWNKPKVLAPAMNNNMWGNPIVQRNINTVKEIGFVLVGPEKGRLACGTEGIGRMSEADDILKAIEDIAGQVNPKKK